MDGRTLVVPKEHCSEHHTLLAFYQSYTLLPWVTKISDITLVRTIGSNFNSPCSVHSQQGHTHLQTPHWVPLHSGGHGTASQRRTDIIHSLHAGQRKTASGQVPKKRALLWLWVFFSLYCWFVKTSAASATTSPLVSSDHQTLTWESWQKAETVEETWQQRGPFIVYSEGETRRGRVGGQAGRRVELMN